MALINTSVPNLIQGVSQQPDATRFAGQCEEQENALSSVAEGLKKRPNTRHIARLLTTAIGEDSFVHFIDRDDAEKYVIIHDGTALKAWNIITGAPATINGASSYSYTPPSSSYLDTATPRSTLKALTVADNTFLLNTTKIVSELTTRTDDLDKEALVFVKQGDYEKEYSINLGDTPVPNVTASISTSNSTGRHHFVSSFDIRHAGFGVGRIKFSIAGVEVSSTEVYDTEGRLISMVPNNSSYIEGEPIANQNQFTYSVQYNDGSGGLTSTPPYTNGVDDQFYGAVNHASGSATGTNAGKNADSRVIAANLLVTLSYTLTSSNSVLAAQFGSSGENKRTGAALSTDFSVRKSGGVIAITKTTASDFTISVSDGLAGGGLGVVYKEVDSLSSLPLLAPNGFEVKIIGDAELNQDDYYVRFSTNSRSLFGDGTWSECVGYNTIKGLDNTTLPMKLVSTATNTFTLEPIDFKERTAGNEDTNPSPSFVNKTISNLFYFKNRLGFLTDDGVSMSEAGEVFNFYRTTVTTLLDSAPIDVTVSSNKVTSLKSAKGFQENLILFGDNNQFVMKGGELLTPKTVSVNPITNFNFEGQVDPLPLGSYIYFPFTRGAFTGMREFTINSTSDTYDSVEVTEHVPAYIPSNIIDMAGTTSEDMIALISGDEKGSLYVYNYFWNNNQKVLSAWSKFTFTGEICGIEFVGSTLYTVITNNGETNLVEMPLEAGLEDTDSPFIPPVKHLQA